MVITDIKTMEVVNKKTNLFLQFHWNTDVLKNIKYERKWKAYHFQGTVPFHDKQGCYALVKNSEVIYIGLGASRGWGLYKEHGIGARINSHVLYWDRSIKTDIENRVYKPRNKWEGITEICTYGFPSDYGYLACALESYLISKLEPEFNKTKNSSKSI